MKTKMSINRQADILGALIEEYGGEPEDWTAQGSFDRVCVKIEETE